MVLASHIIITCYGFWLPNDPRGSWSDFVRNWELYWFGGAATKTTDRNSLAHRPHDHQLRTQTKTKMKYHPVVFTGEQAHYVSKGFRKAIEESGYELLACAIMPSHTHLVASRHATLAERIAAHLKTRAAQSLVADGLHPFVAHRDAAGRFPSVWAHHSWKVFLNSRQAIRSAVRYVQDNPLKEGKLSQRWSFVKNAVA